MENIGSNISMIHVPHPSVWFTFDTPIFIGVDSNKRYGGGWRQIKNHNLLQNTVSRFV